MKNLVCFHIGRGGRFNNQGHKTYRNDIEDFQELLRYYADELFERTEDEDGNQLSNEECCIEDCNGNVLVQGLEAMTGETGVLDFDGDYDTSYVKDIKTCTDEELQIIVDAYNSGDYVDDDILDTVCNDLCVTHVHRVDAYKSNMYVYTNSRSQLGNVAKDNWQGCSREDFEDWLREDMCVLARDLHKVVDVCDTYEWFD